VQPAVKGRRRQTFDRGAGLSIASSRMAFRGWPAEALEFFEGLEADNSKAYWQDNKPTYDVA
jgi:hypothetical protein